MTCLDTILGAFFLLAAGLAIGAHRRYLVLQRKHKLLQRLYDKAEQQLSSLWANKKA